MDESNAITWLRYLLDIADLKRNALLEQQKKVAEFLDRTTIRPVDFRCFDLAGGCTPLSAGAKTGHYRCALHLLRPGAVSETMHYSNATTKYNVFSNVQGNGS
jgi:hypothetical protein